MVYLETRRLNNITLPVPKELYKMLNYILDHGKSKPNIFLNSGSSHLAKSIREKIDTNVPLDPTVDDPYTVASVLLDFLETLLTPILP